MQIEVLSNEMASRIAAGEVVERPASVVKELIENALDAGATEISVCLEKSGTALIRVPDTVSGMQPDDLSLSVERHATSKLKAEEDLFRIATLGFRGEALPSIGSVSRMQIVSRAAPAPAAHCLEVIGGIKQAVRPAGAAPGTTVEIKDIFYNTPARRKFLKSPATELSHICDVVNRMALAHPGVHFRLEHDSRRIADYPAASDPRIRLQQVLGRDVAHGLVALAGGAGSIQVHGFVSAAPASFPNARHLYTFVNRRYVRDRVLTHAILFGYDTLLMKGQYPAVVLFLELPYEDVDVNVHPAKYEVRFRRQGEVHEAVSRTVRGALQLEAKGPSSVTGNVFSRPVAEIRESPFPYGPSCAPIARSGVVERAELATLAPFASVNGGPGYFASLQILGQILGCYIVCVSPGGLVLIDQHAAHERVAFERLRRQLDDGNVETQHLLIPQTIDLTAGETMLLDQKLKLLAALGFVVAPFGPTSYAITAVPALLAEGDYAGLVRQMVAELAEIETSEKLRQHLEEKLATMACHSVIRANRRLEPQEMRALLQALDETDFARQCPHGRPVLIEWRQAELDRIFRRIV